MVRGIVGIGGRYLTAIIEIYQKLISHALGKRRIVNEHVTLGVMKRRPACHIVGADGSNYTVHDKIL